MTAAYVGSECPPGGAPLLAARVERGEVDLLHLDEGVLLAGLNAAAQRLPFATWMGAIGTDSVGNRFSSEAVDTVTGSRYVRVDPIDVDVAIVWAEAGDPDGNLVLWGPDFGDPSLLAAADVRIAQVERVIDTAELRPYRDRVIPWAADIVVPVAAGTYPFGGFGCDIDRAWISEYLRSANVAAKGATDLSTYVRRVLLAGRSFSEFTACLPR